jgi:CBS domain-containing protein
MNNSMLDEIIITVKDLMTRGIISVLPESTVVEAVKVMSNRDISSLLVMKEGKYVGIFTDRDVMKKVVALGLDPKLTIVGDIMSFPLITVSEDTGIEAAAEKMRERKIRRLVVKNKIRRLVVKNESGVVGIISETDIARVEPELHLLIREHTRLQLPSSDYSTVGENFVGYCEECSNYSSLENRDGRWLCKECI